MRISKSADGASSYALSARTYLCPIFYHTALQWTCRSSRSHDEWPTVARHDGRSMHDPKFRASAVERPPRDAQPLGRRLHALVQ